MQESETKRRLFKRPQIKIGVIAPEAPPPAPVDPVQTAFVSNQTAHSASKLGSLMTALKGLNKTLVDAFREMDVDKDKALSLRELSEGLSKLKVTLNLSDVAQLFKEVDKNQDAKVTIEEVTNAVASLVAAKSDYNKITPLAAQSATFSSSNQSGEPNKRRADTKKRETKMMESQLLRESLLNSSLGKKADMALAESQVQSYLDRVEIKPEDYFNQFKTVFNDPIKCLKYCMDTVRELNTKSGGERKYKDPEFGPKLSDPHGYGAICFEPKYPDAPPIDMVVWKRPDEIFASPVKCRFLIEGATSNDVTQGNIGDCWIIGALNIISQHDELLVGKFKLDADKIDKIPTDEEAANMLSGIYPPIFHHFSKYGLYVMRFYKNFAWRYVVVDDMLPCLAIDNELELFLGSSNTPGELWVPLVEKAYSKIHGAYQALISGDLSDGLVDLTGLVSEKLMFNNNGTFNTKLLGSPQSLWNRIINLHKDGALMGCSIIGKGIEKEIFDDGVEIGLLAGHAYSIQSAFTIIEEETRQEVRLMRIRNPWGFKKPKEWGGRWSDNSAEMVYNWKNINAKMEEVYQEEAELIHIDSQNDGNFFMCFEDFVKYFSKLSICIKFPTEYDGLRFFGEWKGDNAGGTPYKERPAQIESWGKNVQYYISVTKKTHLFVSLGQEDGRLKASGTEVYPFASSIYSVMVLILKANGSKKVPYSRSQLVADTPMKQFRESSLNTILEPGEYVIVPSTKEPGQEGKYFLSVYHNGGTGTTLKNLDTGEGPVIIPEESETAQVMDPGLKKFLKQKITEHKASLLELGASQT